MWSKGGRKNTITRQRQQRESKRTKNIQYNESTDKNNNNEQVRNDEDEILLVVVLHEDSSIAICRGNSESWCGAGTGRTAAATRATSTTDTTTTAIWNWPQQRRRCSNRNCNEGDYSKASGLGGHQRLLCGGQWHDYPEWRGESGRCWRVVAGQWW